MGCSGEISRPLGKVFDAGAVFADATPVISHRFTITNTTKRPVKILEETHSCTCTAVEVEHRLLNPGESMVLKMSVRVPTGYSEYDISCTLKTDHPTLPNWDYRIRYRTFPRARVISDRITLEAIRTH